MGVDLEPVGRLCESHVSNRTSLVMLLQETQDKYGYLPREVLKQITREIDVPLARLYGLATFYRSFTLTPRGKHELCVCTGTACHVRGAPTVLQHLQRRLGVSPGETTEDGLFTLVTVNCLGACALGPLLVVDGKYHGKITVGEADELLSSLAEAAQQNPQ
ncbi:MAG: NAD(P)H-dependent oxidoreductase subunit E [Phycisphaerae bacterium]|nr:NAD(P)H-dependent oxidoreductase subunit E [Phycisphaerae bacterium]